MVHCTPGNDHSDLFHGFPNSYGTLGYALRLRLRTIPVKPFVRVEHRPAQTAPGFFEARRDLYNLYPLLVHVQLFGGPYVSSIEHSLARFGV